MKIETIMIGFLGLFIFGYFIEGLTFLKYIGLYGSILFFIIKIVKKEKFNYKYFYTDNNHLLNSLFLFIFILALSIVFAYSNIQPSIKSFRVEFLNIGLFMLISLSIINIKLLSKVLFWSIILAFSFNTIRYGYNYYLNSHFDFSVRLKRNYSDYFEILYPFILASIFILKNRLKHLIIFLLGIGLFELLLTGARGAWVSVIAEIIVFFIFISFIKKEYFKKVLIGSGISVVLLLGIGNYLYNHSSLFKNKIHQGISPNGRMVIIKTRLPIFLKYQNLLLGVGGVGDNQYIKFLNDYNAPKKYGVQYKTCFQYWGDEPFLLQIFYKNGILGITSFLLFIILFLIYMFKFIKNKKYDFNDKIFVLGLMSSFIGYYLVRGLVEGRELKYILIYVTLFLIFKEKDRLSV